jgi:hypothetical protein
VEAIEMTQSIDTPAHAAFDSELSRTKPNSEPKQPTIGKTIAGAMSAPWHEFAVGGLLIGGIGCPR